MLNVVEMLASPAVEQPKTVVVLSGGGGNGSYQYGVLRSLVRAGIRIDGVAGVSVGALNGMLVAQNEVLTSKIWDETTPDDVHKTRGGLKLALHLVTGGIGLNDNRPLKDKIHEVLDLDRVVMPFKVGYVSMATKRYIAQTIGMDTVESYQEQVEAIWASATMPIIWEMIGPDLKVDGGVRHMTPIGDALDMGADRVIVVLCAPYAEDEDLPRAERPSNLVEAIALTFDNMAHGNFRGDVERALDVNAMLAASPIPLPNRKGRLMKHLDMVVVSPKAPLPGGTLSFEQATIQDRIKIGETDGRELAEALTP